MKTHILHTVLALGLLSALAGCTTLTNSATATRPFEEMGPVMRQWVEEQNTFVGSRRGGMPFPGWGRAEVTENSDARVEIRLTREWSVADGSAYKKYLDEAFISANPQSWYSTVHCDVHTRSAIVEAEQRSGGVDGGKSRALLKRALALLGNER